MPSTTDFTWDWIVEACQKQVDELVKFIGQDPKRSYQSQENYKRGFEALILAVAELREHPQLADNVPMKSLATLRWFPHKHYEVHVYYDILHLKYQISIYKRNPIDPYGLYTLIEQTHSYLSKLSDTVVFFIEKAKQLSSD